MKGEGKEKFQGRCYWDEDTWHWIGDKIAQQASDNISHANKYSIQDEIISDKQIGIEDLKLSSGA